MSPSLQSWLGIAGVVAAPITAVSALCYYFGYVSTRKRMAYLGIDSEAVGFSTNDYVVQSAGVLYVIALSAAVIFAVVFAVCVAFRRFAQGRRHPAALRWTVALVVGVGVLAILRGVIGVWRPQAFSDERGWLTPVALALGAALVILGGWMHRVLRSPSQPILPLAQLEWVLLASATSVLVLGLFWTTNVFATKAGEVEGINAVADLWSRPSTVILDTPDRLFLPSNLVRETQLTEGREDGGPRYRYECLRTIAVRGDRWILLPANWRPEFGYAVIVTADSSHRVTLRSIKGAPERMGNGSNVRDHWPCPELVSTANGDAVQAQLLSADGVRRLTGLPGLTVSKEYVQRPQTDSAPGEPSCIGAVNPTAQEPALGGGFIQRYGRELIDAPHGSRVDESVVEFSTARQASEYYERTTGAWRSCAHTELALAGKDLIQHIRFGELQDDRGVRTLAMSRDDEAAQCSHASAAISNVVSDVVVCGPEASDRAAAVAQAIRDRFPK